MRFNLDVTIYLTLCCIAAVKFFGKACRKMNTIQPSNFSSKRYLIPSKDFRKRAFLYIIQEENVHTLTGTQIFFGRIFRGRAGFLEWRYFDKPFMCDTQKKDPAGRNFGVFSPRCSQKCILNDSLTHRWTRFCKIRALFSIFKKFSFFYYLLLF